MKNKQAFTLIELLVVVLIIGILAAVALPQYQKAVWKSRATQLITAVKSIQQSKQVYYLANGQLPTSFDELATDIPFKWACSFSDLSSFGGTEAGVCRKDENSMVLITPAGTVFAVFMKEPYFYSGFKFQDGNDDLLCFDAGQSQFCKLMGYNTQVACNSVNNCTYSK